MRLIPTPGYDAAYKRLSYHQKELVDLALELFEEDPFYEKLHNHELLSPMNGKWAFSADKDLRVIYRPLGGWDKPLERIEILTIDVGRHEDVYEPR